MDRLCFHKLLSFDFGGPSLVSVKVYKKLIEINACLLYLQSQEVRIEEGSLN